MSGNLKMKTKTRMEFQSPSYEIISSEDMDVDFNELKHTGRLVPVYSEKPGLSSKMIRSYVKMALNDYSYLLKETLPDETLKLYNLENVQDSIYQMHFPETIEKSEVAKKRFIFEEMLLVQIHMLQLKKENLKIPSPLISVDDNLLASFKKTLPFILTDAQNNSINEILKDLKSKSPMNRLLEGDVGSGKTLVAMSAGLIVCSDNYQAAFMAPTEVLAKQHFLTAKKLFKNFDIKLALFTSDSIQIKDGNLEGKISKDALKHEIEKGNNYFIIGTQSLIQKDISFSKLGLVIIDEQHRFGVKQRKQLLTNDKLVPHLLSMTATPIPRTLALAVYGDLNLSILDELPQGRKPIKTRVVSKRYETQLFDFIEKQILKKKQVFIICPRVEPSEENESFKNLLMKDVASVKKEYERISSIFSKYSVAMLHGKMKPIEKEKTMRDFSENKINILVATSVIEVGVDVPNATTMVIEGAERFGLAQLHQFRGRVGRGVDQSFCFLMSESYAKNTRDRLKALVEYNNGFKLAEIDLATRGPGQFFGLQQSGIPDLAMSSLKDLKLLAQIQKEAQRLANIDSSLSK
ncbi:MAG: ATP-dependent DNA helicase RecG [Candidatus Pacebacteria bacterium]|nr:ATP-dependent DNA helicase RecG [Candidatus Paceibacterota bacterium]